MEPSAGNVVTQPGRYFRCLFQIARALGPPVFNQVVKPFADVDLKASSCPAAGLLSGPPEYTPFWRKLFCFGEKRQSF